MEKEHAAAGQRLRLTGRNPIEHVPPAPCIPLFLESYYSDAIIAFACGFIRIGIFGLRTVIEQWARAATGIATKIDGAELFEKYSTLLPVEFRSLYPSLGALYSDLSADMHGAVGEPELFERAQKELESHFGALRSLSNLNPAIAGALSRK